MPQRMLNQEQALEVLAGEMLVRVGFCDEGCPYVIPFGYVYLERALYGITPKGRKTRIVEQNPQVGFQVDSSARSGPWEWKSVTGQGQFELVESKEELGKALAALEPLISNAPNWWQEEIRPLVAAGAVLVWKITPSRVDGVEYVHPSVDPSLLQLGVPTGHDTGC